MCGIGGLVRCSAETRHSTVRVFVVFFILAGVLTSSGLPVPRVFAFTSGNSSARSLRLALRPPAAPLPANPAATVKIMPLGDSITLGVGDDNPSPAGYR